MKSYFTSYAGFIMALIYILFGATLLFTNILPPIISNSQAIGGVILVYGVFRMIIAIQKRKKRLHEEE